MADQDQDQDPVPVPVPVPVPDKSYILRYLPLYKAALTDDWNAANTFLVNNPNADISASITFSDETALHIAVAAKSSHRFVTALLQHVARTYPAHVYAAMLRQPDCVGNTALHFAAKAGNIKDARILVEGDRDHLPLIRNGMGVTAMKLAAWYGRKETLEYLIEVTPNVVVVEDDGTRATPYTSLVEGDLMTIVITAGFYDIAWKLMNAYPDMVNNHLINNGDGFTALRTLATHPEAFPSSRNWWFGKNLIYSCLPESNGCFSSILKYVPILKSILGTKMVEKQADRLMKAMIQRVMTVGNVEAGRRNYNLVWDVLGTAMHAAAQHGIHELIEECVSHYPGLIWYDIDEMFLFMVAIKYRQVKVYNLHYQMTGHSAHAGYLTINQNNVLHLAGKIASPDRLNIVTGAALQMQRELQWFKEVEKFVEPSYKKALNEDDKTPQMLFTEEHKELVEKGEKWIKDSASSSALVAILIVTVAFAAIFTVPGGIADNGTPHFVGDMTFMVFAGSDSLALFSAVTSVLMFSALLTSRYSEDDFLTALPMRMTIGLLSLFISIASIMVTFCAALVLLMRAEVSWIAIIPVGVVAGVPVTLFALLQFPLLVELFLSTFWCSIFRKQNNVILH